MNVGELRSMLDRRHKNTFLHLIGAPQDVLDYAWNSRDDWLLWQLANAMKIRLKLRGMEDPRGISWKRHKWVDSEGAFVSFHPEIVGCDIRIDENGFAVAVIDDERSDPWKI